MNSKEETETLNAEAKHAGSMPRRLGRSSVLLARHDSLKGLANDGNSVVVLLRVRSRSAEECAELVHGRRPAEVVTRDWGRHLPARTSEELLAALGHRGMWPDILDGTHEVVGLIALAVALDAGRGHEEPARRQ